MSHTTEDNPVKMLSLKLVYPIAAVVAFLVIANLLSRPDSGRPEQRPDDFLGRVEQAATPWLGRAEKASDVAGGFFDACTSCAGRLVESFNRQPDGK